jgi:hypothetical protein
MVSGEFAVFIELNAITTCCGPNLLGVSRDDETPAHAFPQKTGVRQSPKMLYVTRRSIEGNLDYVVTVPHGCRGCCGAKFLARFKVYDFTGRCRLSTATHFLATVCRVDASQWIRFRVFVRL